MKRRLKNLAKYILAFLCEQYVVLILILGIGVKQYFVSTYIINLTWSIDYRNSILIGFVSSALIFAPLYFIPKYKNRLAKILAILLSALLVVDIVYFSYFSSLPTMGILSSINQVGDVSSSVYPLIKWWLVLFFADIILLWVFGRKIQVFVDKQKEKLEIKKQLWAPSVAVALLTIATLLIALPGGFSVLSFVWDRGFDTATNAQYYNVLMSQSIDLVRYIKQETTSLSNDEKSALKNWVVKNKPAQAASSLNGIAKGKNVIMIQVESLGGFVINQTVNGKEVTPTLDELAKTSQYFPNERFIIGAGHTSDTDFVSNTSYFPMVDASVFIRYGLSNFTSLPKTLIENGYSADAYHGYNRHFWNRDDALRSLGYQKFYAADNFSKGAKINLGLNDGDFLSQSADLINKQPKPSFSYLITLSSHVPFEITDATKELGIDPADYPDQVGGYLEDINYTDRMIGKFFDKLKADNLYDDSLILVYGDHNPVLPSFTAGSIDFDTNSDQNREVPLLIKLPNETTGKVYPHQGNHIDITPTIFDLLGIKTIQLMFGQSLFASGTSALQVCQDQMVAFPSNNCAEMLDQERFESSTIIRYNQFKNIQSLGSQTTNK